ncbi:MAG: hypothetical protein M3N42_16915, partial [Cyanobacteriota bacterium]|nr:hypothetical protein [Cyanobacteriota bacterium]
PKEEVLVVPSKDGKTLRPMSSLLVHAIYEFFTVCEKSGWKQISDVVPPSPEQQAEMQATAPDTSEKK